MYILRDNEKNAYLNYDNSWVSTDSNGVLDLSNVARFTKREAEWNSTEDRYCWVWFGAYPSLEELVH